MVFTEFFYRDRVRCYRPTSIAPESLKKFYNASLKKYAPFIGKKYFAEVFYVAFQVSELEGGQIPLALGDFAKISWKSIKENFVNAKKLDIEQKQLLSHITKDIYMDVVHFLTNEEA